ncbi:9512_t:CDS:1, partial [Cetraspora pellucida]
LLELLYAKGHSNHIHLLYSSLCETESVSAVVSQALTLAYIALFRSVDSKETW